MPATLIRSAWSSFLPATRDTLVSKVMSLYGIGTDSELEAKAEEFLNEGIDELNTHLWEFNKTKEELIPLVASQPYVQVQNEVFKESSAWLVSTTSGDNDNVRPLSFHDWTQLTLSFGGSDDTGTPTSYGIENLHLTGRLHLFPCPATSDVTNWTLTFQYYRRISHLDAQGGSKLQVPREAEQMILNHAYQRMAAHLKGASDPDVAAYSALSIRAFENLKGLDRRQPDANSRFRLLGGWGPIRMPSGGQLPLWWCF